MKKLLLIFGTIALALALGLRGYFAVVPPPEPTLEEPLTQIFPDKLPGWRVEDMDVANTEEASNRVSNFLNFDDALVRSYTKGDTFIRLYIAYWKPGTASYRWAGVHTPDTCWVKNGWSCDEREYSIPFSHNSQAFEPAEYGIYSINGHTEVVYFWHLVGGRSYSYKQHSLHNIWGALTDIRDHGLKLREEQFFIRFSSNKTLDELNQQAGTSKVLDAMKSLGMEQKSPI